MTVTTDVLDHAEPTGRLRPHLLVADDVPVLRKLIAEALGTRGFDVTAVADGLAALNAYGAIRPDLVLTDLQMPRLDGFGLARALRGRGERVPILMLTARDDTATRRTAVAVGVDDLLIKPFGLAELAGRVRRALVPAASGM
ncbi:MAG: response regulator [Pseudonocardia sp.]|nr:response regulator [Pseudonocardia sp.]